MSHHAKLLEAAKQAIIAVACDPEVSLQTVRESMEQLADDINVRLHCIQIEEKDADNGEPPESQP